MVQLSPEIVDVNIKPVFNWFGQQEIVDTQGNTFTVYIRLVGDEDLNRARVAALRKSNELRKKLRDPESDEYNALILFGDFLSKEQLVSEIINYNLIDLYQKAGKEVRIPYPKEPAGDAELEKQEQYQQEIDTWQDRLNAKIQDWLEPRLSKLTLDTEAKSEEVLRKEYKQIKENQVCNAEFQKRFKELCVFYGTFSDSEMKETFFESYEDFANQRSEVKEQYIEFYEALDLSSDELKK